MKIIYLAIIVMLVPVAMYFLMHARIWPEPELCDVGFSHYHFGYCGSNSFTASFAFAEEIKPDLNCEPGTVLQDGVCVVTDDGCEPDMYGNIYCDDIAREDGQRINLKNAIEYFFGRGNYERVIHYENYLIFFIIPVAIILVLIWRTRK